jgi:phospholipid/cholesterol/gamma-HCH transport system permease protein
MKSSSFEIVEEQNGNLIVNLIGRMDFQTSSPLMKALIEEINARSPESLFVNLEKTSYFDDYGLLVLNEIKMLMEKFKGNFKIIDPDRKADKILSFIDIEKLNKAPHAPELKHDNLVMQIGQSALSEAFNIKSMISFLGSVVIAFSKAFFRPSSLRTGDTVIAMEKTGVNAMPIVALISFLLGLVIAFMSSLQLKQFGANIYVASLVSIAMVSELGPIMTAIVVAGRSGSAFAAEIGTMKISEEIDALTTMGFDPVLFLAVPRILASFIVMPVLTLFSDLFGVIGGLVVGVSMLNLTASSYISNTLDALMLFDILWGIMKSLVFAVLISWVGCLRGFQAKGGADSVGNAATSAVVSGIFLIVLFDSFFAVIRSYL